MNQRLATLGLALTIAIVSFIMFRSPLARSTVQTVETTACNYSSTAYGTSGYWACPVTGGDLMMTANGPYYAYADFFLGKAASITTYLEKKSTAGTYYSDSRTSSFGTGNSESYVAAANTRINVNVWDYYFLFTVGLNQSNGNVLWGMAVSSY